MENKILPYKALTACFSTVQDDTMSIFTLGHQEVLCVPTASVEGPTVVIFDWWNFALS